MAQVTFWFELASTYSYVSAARIDKEASKRGLDVRWRPFLLGPIFKSQGWDTSPFKVYPAKGTYMWRDMERLCAAQGLSFQPPADLSGFPRHSVLAARLAIAGLKDGWGKDFVKAAYRAEFGDGQDIADPKVLTPILTALGVEAQAAFEAAQHPATKAALRENTDAAIATGLFGAPSLTVDGELFWGNDRLEDALEWAVKAQ
jgi:2-hydroxychromene-2-carboxylate isomerase